MFLNKGSGPVYCAAQIEGPLQGKELRTATQIIPAAVRRKPVHKGVESAMLEALKALSQQ